VREKFHSQFSYAAELFFEVSDSDPVKKKYPLLFMTARAPGHSQLGPELHLDLVKANTRQLLDAGLQATNIEPSELCTSCRTDILFSHRAEHGKAGRMLAGIALMR
jgi:copper oxidase (laccase) domain-containing protein